MNQSNLVHQHVYYSNRFEPGKLFPEIITNGFNNNLYGDQSLRAFIMSGIQHGESLAAGNDAFGVFSLGEYRLTTVSNSMFQHVPLYYTAPTEDFDLQNGYVGLITFTLPSEHSSSLPLNSVYTGAVKDFTFTDVSSVQTTYGPVLSTVSHFFMADLSSVNISMTSVPSDLILGSAVLNVTIQ